MILFTLLLAGSAVGYALSLRFRVPPFPFLLLAGFLLSRTPLVQDPSAFQDYLLLGLSLLVFSSGMDLHPRRAGSQAKVALAVGLAQFVVLGGIGAALGTAMGFQAKEIAYFGVALAASSTLVVVHLLKRRQQLFEPFGRLVVGVLLVQDLLVIMTLGALHQELTTGLFEALALVVMTFIFARLVAPRLILRYQFDEETLLLVALSVLFVYIGLAHLGDLPTIIGAFLAGVALSDFPVDGVVRGHLKTLKTFFHALFFTCLGALISLEGSVLWHALVFATALLLVTPVLVGVLAEKAGLTAKSALESGMLLSQTSEFSLVVALIGLSQGDIRPSTFSTIVLITVISMLWTPTISSDRFVRHLLRLYRRRGSLSPEALTGHDVVLGAGDSGSAIARELHRRGRTVVVVDQDPVSLESLEKQGLRTLSGDGADPDCLEAASIKNAELIISTLGRLEDHLAVIRGSQGIPTWVRIFDDHGADQVRQAGGRPVVIAEASAKAFLDWFEHEFRSNRVPTPDSVETSAVASGIKKFREEVKDHRSSDA